ncbi:Pimeloyl-ACP methyl ester carboxylesterase [Dyadobacter koreensis]|uniref:Pimeloyl-ACP methyl ester carboxylesterase n=1 Tax=Dyadobacter koreensis TaxID=408657 RepID=A0A1H6QAL6_9BACT|nr:alpha/beta hydrolase [Dyadobacter koreensis]SEI37197.1 Pimeloyl-ACP methyl ester carboxylesterase [Dyadobacter koreensis]
MKKTIVFIHGMFQNPKSWEKWINHFTELGYNCVAPAWPYHEGEPERLRENIPSDLGDLMLDDVISTMENAVIAAGGNNTELSEKPIIIGHSVGGLLAQIFVSRNLASLGVPISSVAPNMMMTLDWPFFKNVSAIANPFKGDEPFLQTPESFHESFCNTLSEAEASQAFRQTATHDSRNVLRGCLGESGQIDLDMPHVPLLFISGKEDKIIPTELVEKNCKAYTDSIGGMSSYKEFPDRSHYICGEPGWEEVAAFIQNWIETQEIKAAQPVM